MTIGAERPQCPEVLFQPNVIGKESEGIHKLAYESIKECDVDIPNIDARLTKEMTALALVSIKVKNVEPV